MSREVIQLDAEEQHELLFRIQVEGNDVSPARVRLVCEGEDMSYMFNGRSSGEEGIVQFALPAMKDKIKEGVHAARVEVLIDNKYFAPVQFDIDFKRPVKVYAEALKVLPPVTKKPEIKVSAEAVTVRHVDAGPKPLVIEAIPTPPKPVEVTLPESEVKLDPPKLAEPAPVAPRPELNPVELPTETPVVVVPAPMPPPSMSMAEKVQVSTPKPRPVPGSLRDRYQQKRVKSKI